MNVSGTIDAILGQKGSEIFSVSPDATVYEAIDLMASKNVGALLVVQDERLLGMISERDYTRKVMLRGKRSRETQVREIMSSDLTIVTPREPIENCLRMMTEKRIRHLPVVEGDTLRGVISIGDLVKWVIASQSAAIAHLAHSTPERFLFSSTDFNSYVTVAFADGAPQRTQGRLAASREPGLGVQPKLDVLGKPLAVFSQT